MRDAGATIALFKNRRGNDNRRPRHHPGQPGASIADDGVSDGAIQGGTMTDIRLSAGLLWAAVGLALASPTASGQVVERHAKKSGPNGGTIERSIRTERGPGY